jgi:hypothetical protein
MRSPADTRRVIEWGLRGVLVALLATALWRLLHETTPAAGARAARTSTLARALHDASADARIGAIDLELDSMPAAPHRAWLAALRDAGVAVRWHGAPPALGIAAERVREPDAPVRVLLVASPGATLALSDSAGALDTVRAARGGATLEASDVVGEVRARSGAWTARIAPPPAGTRRAVLVLGRAGWESRFVIAALGEAGWSVRARLPAAPGVAVSDAGLLPIDTTRYDVVVALDSSAADLAPAIVRFVRAGGGLVAAGSATTLDAFRGVLPARTGARLPGRILLETDSVTRAVLPIRPLTALRSDAIPLERQAAGIATAVRRAGPGRALSIGYDESWRWRMLGGASGLPAHRAWWSRSVGLVAPEREDDRASATGMEAAPLAALVATLGPPSSASSVPADRSGDALPLWLLASISAALLAETASRRFRGAR